MAYVQFSAKRFLVNGYSVDDQVELAFGIQEDKPDFEIFGTEHITYNRTRSIRNHGEESRFSITTTPIEGFTNNQMMRMFLYSVYRTQTFTIDLYNNVNLNPITAYVGNKPSSPVRLGKNIYVYEFDLLEVA